MPIRFSDRSQARISRISAALAELQAVIAGTHTVPPARLARLVAILGPHTSQIQGIYQEDLSRHGALAAALDPFTSVLMGSSTFPANGPPFPRLASHIASQSPRPFDQDYFVLWAQHHLLQIMGMWAGWEISGRLRTAKQITDEAHAGTLWGPTWGTKMCRYHDLMHIASTDPSYPPQLAAGFMLRNNYPAGTLTPHGTAFIPNIAPGGPTLAGRDCARWQTDYMCDYHYDGSAAGLSSPGDNKPNPSLDGSWFDDLTFQSQDGGDYNRDNVNDADSAAASALLRQGWANVFARLRANKPTKLMLANLSQIQKHATPSEIAELTGQLDGGGMEGMLGKSWSVETGVTGWQGMMAVYATQMAFCRAPKLVSFMHGCMTSNGRDFYRQDRPYQALRYGEASCSMDNGYYCQCPIGNVTPTIAPASGDFPITVLPQWFDEFSIDPNTMQALSYVNAKPGLGWMGYPIDAGPVTVAWKQGLMRRRFRRANGKEAWKIVNPKGNAAQDFTTGQTMQKFFGIQDPGLNNGAIVTASQVLHIPINEGLTLVQP